MEEEGRRILDPCIPFTRNMGSLSFIFVRELRTIRVQFKLVTVTRLTVRTVSVIVPTDSIPDCS